MNNFYFQMKNEFLANEICIVSLRYGMSSQVSPNQVKYDQLKSIYQTTYFMTSIKVSIYLLNNVPSG